MKAARALCRQVMSGPPPAADLAQVCERLSVHRGRSIRLLAFAGVAEGPSGVWIQGQSCDYVCFDSGTSGVHRDVIIWHELAHLLLDHRGPRADEAVAALLAPDLDPRLVARMLARAAYDLPAEREAEELASLLALDQAELMRPAGSALQGRLRSALNLGRP